MWITPEDGAARSVHTNFIYCIKEIYCLVLADFIHLTEFEFADWLLLFIVFNKNYLVSKFNPKGGNFIQQRHKAS